MTKMARSGSISPDPYQNVTDPQHCINITKSGYFNFSKVPYRTNPQTTPTAFKTLHVRIQKSQKLRVQIREREKNNLLRF
jgi:hypothetical protein